MAHPVIPNVESVQATSSSALEKMGVAPAENKMPWWKKFFGRESDTHDQSAAISSTARRTNRKVVPGLPRPGTFKRQQSELRDRLEPIQPNSEERRAVSVDRRWKEYNRSASPAPATAPPRISAPDVLMGPVRGTEEIPDKIPEEIPEIRETPHDEAQEPSDVIHLNVPEIEPSVVSNRDDEDAQSRTASSINEELWQELEKRWILNLSMHFRDKSNREKFFVTYAETPTFWRRVTISMDYREAQPGSLEWDLQHTRFQRDKSARIYDSIRESLQDIQFYNTVTNLKLQTEKERLHVHVTEDLHEIIQYPPVHAIQHLDCRRVREQDLKFDSHLSGFVYKVEVGNEILIKKEIPGPDTVEEFLYEINALKQLEGSSSVIQFGGVIVDNEEKFLKGLLISYAERGTLVDILYDDKGKLPWARRQRWAKQIVQGLSEIHDAGFVQGDFTLSNIVIDGDDNAKIIDINRRGCPLGWEPPEIAALVDSRQKINIYIGVKSDIFQLGMVLWAIAMENDEPERYAKPLRMSDAPDDIPAYFRDIVSVCLSERPRDRIQASVLLGMFPENLEFIGPANTESIASYSVDSAPAYPGHIASIHQANSKEYFADGSSKNHQSTYTYVESGEGPYPYPQRGRSTSPRPVNGHSPSPRTLYVVSPSLNDTLEKEKLSSQHDVRIPSSSDFDNGFRKLRIVSPPSPPLDPSPVYTSNENPPPHFIDLELESPPHTYRPSSQDDPRETVADIPRSTSFLDCTDLVGVGAHHNVASCLEEPDILSELDKLRHVGDDSRDYGEEDLLSYGNSTSKENDGTHKHEGRDDNHHDVAIPITTARTQLP